MDRPTEPSDRTDVPAGSDEDAAPAQPSPSATRKRPSRPVLIAGAVGAIAILAAAGFFVARALSPNPFEAAIEDCGLDELSFAAYVADDGDTLILDHKGAEDLIGLDYDQFACVLSELDVSTSVLSRMDNTRALDGQQSASWDDYEITWSYHPDTGIAAIVER